MNTSSQPPKVFDHRKYAAFPTQTKTDRHWPDTLIKAAPQWCSVDLRDGNQALIDPMTPEQKLAMFNLLVSVGFKDIEVGFPAASQTDFDFVRKLIDEQRIPADVRIQVLTQAREPLIARTFESLKGAPRAILHLYNSTSKVQREKVFNLSQSEIRNIAVEGARSVKRHAEQQPETHWTFQYSPESFTATEPDFAVEVCNAVNEVWRPTPANKTIINLPATVEVSTPNIYADRIEWFCEHIDHRDALVISLHTHNDRGCAVAAAELGVMAGADRIEGTLLGNGERTGNMDIVTMAMNLYSQGIDPELDLSDMDRIIHQVESCTQIQVHPRHPYAGELVFSAFSGSHQDAIRKCLAEQKQNAIWDVAYLPIDPRDLGRDYQEIIRINSQSGKGGIAWILEQNHGLQLPRWLQIDFSGVIQNEADNSEVEVSSEKIWSLFQTTYMADDSESISMTTDSDRSDGRMDNIPGDQKPFKILGYQLTRNGNQDRLQASIGQPGQATKEIQGLGRGVLEAFVNALTPMFGATLNLIDYSEHTLGHNAEADAICYVQLSVNGQRLCAAGQSQDIVGASMQAVLNAVSRSRIEQANAA